MNQPIDTELLLRTWFEDEAAAPPEALLAAVRTGVAGTRQRPAWLLRPEVPPMARPMRLALLLAVVTILMAALAATFLASGSPWGGREFENGRITYLEGLPPGDQQDIFVANADGTGAVAITATPQEEEYPTWSPDGSLIAFVRQVTSDEPPSTNCLDTPEICEQGTPGTTGVFVIRPDGSGERLLVGPLPSPVYGLAWSPDGTRLSFIGGTGIGLVVVNLDGSGLRHLMDEENVEAGIWSPDGRSVVFNGWEQANDADLYLVDVNSGFAQQLTADVGWETHPRWSPDGRQIVFWSDPDGSGERARIEVIGADGEGRRVVSDFGIHPHWSPDGNLIVFDGWVEPGVWVVRPDGSGLRRVTDGENPRWSPDGNLVVVRDRDGIEWWTVRRDGTDRQPLHAGTTSAWDWEAVPR